MMLPPAETVPASLAVLASSACLAGGALWPRRLREAVLLLRRGVSLRPIGRRRRGLAPPIPFPMIAFCLVAAFAAPLLGPWSWAPPHALPPPILPGAPLGLALLLLAAFDARLYRLPDGLTLAVLLSGFAAAEDPDRALIGLVAWGGLPLLLPVILDRLSPRSRARSGARPGLGRGDVKLMAGLGAWLGPFGAALAIAGAALAAAATLVLLAALLRRPAREVPIAFGVFLALALWWGWLAGIGD